MIFNNQSISKQIPIVENFGNMNFETDIAYMNMSIEEDAYNVISQHMISTYHALKEGNVYILEEGFSDFIQTVVRFFKELIRKIVDFGKRAHMYISSFIGDFSKFLEKYKGQLSNIDRNFDVKGYTFTFINAPILTEMDKIINEFNSSLATIDSMKMEDVVKMRDEFSNLEYQNKIRGSVIGNGSVEVDSDQFMLTIKGIFRNGNADTPENIHVNQSYINKIVNEYASLRKDLNQTEVIKSKIIRSLDTMQTFFQRKAQVSYNKTEKIVKTNQIYMDDNTLKAGETQEYKYNYDSLRVMNMYFDLMYKKSKLVSSCVSNVYFEKIRAYKECLAQYRTITRMALFGRDDAVKEKEKEEEK